MIFDRELLDDTDSRVAYFSSTFLLKVSFFPPSIKWINTLVILSIQIIILQRMMTEEADNYQRGLSSLVSRAQQVCHYMQFSK